jgi:hypothetical protein
MEFERRPLIQDRGSETGLFKASDPITTLYPDLVIML